MPIKLFSVIVPAYKQERTIEKDLKSIESVLKKIRFDYEIICVVDGRVDKTLEKAKKIKYIKLIKTEINKTINKLK